MIIYDSEHVANSLC